MAARAKKAQTADSSIASIKGAGIRTDPLLTMDATPSCGEIKQSESEKRTFLYDFYIEQTKEKEKVA